MNRGTLREVCCSTQIAREGATAMKVTKIVGYVAGAFLMVTPAIATADIGTLNDIDKSFNVHDQLAGTAVAGDIQESIAIAKTDVKLSYENSIKTASFGRRGGFGFSYFGGSPFYGGGFGGSAFSVGFSSGGFGHSGFGFNRGFVGSGFGFNRGFGGFNRGFIGSRGFGGSRFIGSRSFGNRGFSSFNRGFGSRGFSSRGFNRGFSRSGFSSRRFSGRGFRR